MSIGGLIRRNLFWVNDYINGCTITSHFDDIKRILNNPKYGTERQKQYLDNLINHATKYSLFYESYKGKRLDSFPIMNKQLIKENFNKLAVKPTNIPGQKGNLHIQHTSGSTGIPLSVPQDTRKRNRRIAELKYFGTIAGFKSHEKLLQLKAGKRWLDKKSSFQSFKENIYFANCSHISDKTLEDICNFIQKKRITVLYGYPNWFELFITFLEKRDLQLKSIKIIIAISEHLSPITRKKLQNVLHCEVVSRYSNEEQGILAQDKNDGECFFLNSASYFFEFLKLDSNQVAAPGELCRIIVTDYFNYAFPMIRYDTGDTCILGNASDNTKEYIVLKKIYGRLTDLIFDTRGMPIHPFSFTFLKEYDAVVFWQFIQKSRSKYLLKLKVSNVLNQKNIKLKLKKIVGEDAKISIEMVDDIPLLPSGKRKPVICEINEK